MTGKIQEFEKDRHERRRPRPIYEDEEEPTERTKRPRGDLWAKVQITAPTYQGKNWAELQACLARLQVIFLQEENFKDDTRKVAYASTCLRGAMELRWQRYLQKHPITTISWKKYQEWLEEEISDGPTRTVKTVQKLIRMKLAVGQRFRTYADHYEATLSEIPEELPEMFQVALFLETLPVDFRAQVLSKGVPKDWKELLTQGAIAETLLEAAKSSGEAHPRSHPRHHGSTNTQETRTSADTRTPPNRSSEGANQRFECWKCGKLGHTRDYCRAPDCTTCQSNRHTTETHNKFVGGKEPENILHVRQTQ